MNFEASKLGQHLRDTEHKTWKVRVKLEAFHTLGVPITKRCRAVVSQSLNSIDHAVSCMDTALEQDIKDFKLKEGKK